MILGNNILALFKMQSVMWKSRWFVLGDRQNYADLAMLVEPSKTVLHYQKGNHDESVHDNENTLLCS